VILAALPCIIGFQLLVQAIVLDIQSTPRPGGEPPRRHALLSSQTQEEFPGGNTP